MSESNQQNELFIQNKCKNPKYLVKKHVQKARAVLFCRDAMQYEAHIFALQILAVTWLAIDRWPKNEGGQWRAPTYVTGQTNCLRPLYEPHSAQRCKMTDFRPVSFISWIQMEMNFFRLKPFLYVLKSLTFCSNQNLLNTT